MPLILAGRLALTLARIPGIRHRPLDAKASTASLRHAVAGKQDLQRVQRSLDRIAASVLEKGGALAGSHTTHSETVPDPQPNSLRDGHALHLVGHAPTLCHRALPIILPNYSAVHACEAARPAYVTFDLPDGSLLRPDEALGLPENVLLACPELVFLTLSRRCAVPKAFVLALELCGTYDLAPSFLSSVDGASFLSNARPVMTPGGLESFVRRLPPRTKGRGVALAAARFATCGSASPMESRLFCALALPLRHGGFGLRGLQLNKEITLSFQDRKMLGTSSMRVDIMAGSGRVGIEYESKRWHEEQIDGRRARLDKKRIDVARFHDITILPLTWDIVCDPLLFEEFVTQFARLDGRNLRAPNSAALDERLRLHGHLFGYRARSAA